MTQTLSPLDGRYREQIAPLLDYFSEQALNRARLQVEVEWLILLCNGFASGVGGDNTAGGGGDSAGGDGSSAKGGGNSTALVPGA
ncbi:MAG: hypothetical protein LBB58_02560, partial [Cellulomonadaceae bacterium]|nr:hypothetical protein [Cellulomonadaceae bacterium]